MGYLQKCTPQGFVLSITYNGANTLIVFMWLQFNAAIYSKKNT